jgi:hypothetical protein
MENKRLKRLDIRANSRQKKALIKPVNTDGSYIRYALVLKPLFCPFPLLQQCHPEPGGPVTSGCAQQKTVIKAARKAAKLVKH